VLIKCLYEIHGATIKITDKDVEGSGRGLRETKSRHFPGGTKENH